MANTLWNIWVIPGEKQADRPSGILIPMIRPEDTPRPPTARIVSKSSKTEDADPPPHPTLEAPSPGRGDGFPKGHV